jgi:5S rRNA maturation endonuclease (ribonuclease M5)
MAGNCLKSLERKYEALTRLLDRLIAVGEEGKPIIVEGKKDSAALRELGINASIICIKSSRKSVLDLLKTIKTEREAIILTDFDRHGAELAKTVENCLEELEVRPNLFYRRALGNLVKRDIKDVEGLPSYIEKLKKIAE